MPILHAAQSIEWQDPDLVARPVVGMGTAGFDASALAPDRQASTETDFHRHRKGQLLLWLRGVLTCEVEDSFWIVPPHSALWLPGGVAHRMKVAGTVECYVIYVDPDAAAQLPGQCCTLAASPLLRELAIRTASFPMDYEEGGMASRVAALLLEEIAIAAPGGLQLAMPSDPRLRKMVEAIMKDPAERGTIGSWARRLCVSERTLSRLIAQQTGTSFGRWRRQLHLMLALQWLAEGASIQRIAEDLGYESASSFILMFHKAMGAPPARYMEARRA